MKISNWSEEEKLRSISINQEIINKIINIKNFSIHFNNSDKSKGNK